MRPRTRYLLLLLIVVIVAALALAFFLRKNTPPEVARLLPESDAIVYVNLKPIRSATQFDREWSKKPVTHSAEYQQFLDATGIVFERDLDAVAFALHKMDDPNGPNGPVGYSEVFQGRFDGVKLGKYLASLATAQESYAGHQIFTIPVASETVTTGAGAKVEVVRLLRVTQLGGDEIAASNMPTAEQIHLILDRYRGGASTATGSSLLVARYGDVPVLSGVWAIGHIGLPFAESGKISAMGFQLPLAEDTTFVASLRFTTSLRLRVDEVAATEADAAQSAEALSSLLQLFRSMQSLQSQIRPGGKPAPAQNKFINDFLDSAKIVADKNRAVLTATVPIDLLKQLTAASNDNAAETH